MLTKYDFDTTVKNMLQHVDWIVMPVVNADGYAYTWQSSFFRMWRKTRTINRRSSCRGADPNQDFDFKWGSKSKENLSYVFKICNKQ